MDRMDLMDRMDSVDGARQRYSIDENAHVYVLGFTKLSVRKADFRRICRLAYITSSENEISLL